MEELQDKAPKAYAAFSYLFTDAIEGLGSEAALFTAQVKN